MISNGPKQTPQFWIFLNAGRFEIQIWHSKLAAHTPFNEVVRKKLGGTSQIHRNLMHLVQKNATLYETHYPKSLYFSSG